VLNFSGELRVFDPFGKPVGSLPATGIAVGWSLDGADQASFAVPAVGQKYATQYLQELNRVEFHHEALPQVWTGVILNTKPGGGVLSASCISAEWYYQKRHTEVWTQIIGTGGAIAQELHAQAVRREPLGIVCGEVDRSGAEYYFEASLKSTYDALQELKEMAGGYYWVEKTGHLHSDLWQLRWAKHRGVRRVADVLLCGEVIAEPDFNRSAADVATFAYVLGGGTGSEIWQRLNVEMVNRSARQQYGLMETVIEYPEVIDLTLLQDAGGRDLAKRGKVAKTLGVSVDNRRNIFGTFWVGDTVRALLSGVNFSGFDGSVFVRGVQYNTDTEALGLVVEIV
jgi:hypothetical protein